MLPIPVFRVEKNANYTTMSNYHLLNRLNAEQREMYRTLPLVAPLEAILKRMKAEQEENRKLCGNCYCQDYLGYIYVNELGELIKPGYLSSHVPAVLKEHNMPPIRFHDLRHTYAVNCIRAGDDIKTVQSNLGHATAAFTLDVYGHFTDDMRSVSAQRMEGFITNVLNL